jgi:cytochrome c peroxidase
MRKAVIAVATLSVFIAAGWALLAAQEKAAAKLSPLEQLGKRLFFDTNLSSPPGQSCAACHAPQVGFTGPDEDNNKKAGVYEGAVKGRFGNRKPPAASYAGESPDFARVEGKFVGGMFWDGRATGQVLHDALAEQAQGPFLNPLEQNLAGAKDVIAVVRASDYAGLFEQVWGQGSLAEDKDLAVAYARVARSIAAYERSSEVNPFSSKFDEFWRAAEAKDLDVAKIAPKTAKKYEKLGLEAEELKGLVLFAGKAKCANCHVLVSSEGRAPVFTDYTYDNIGVPRNPENPFYKMDKAFNPAGEAWVDDGLGGFLKTVPSFKKFASDNIGKHKVPTLRNVDLRPSPDFVKCFMHNGYFKSLKDVVHFYNTRDRAGAKWPAPEVSSNLNKSEMGNLALTEDEENAVVAFMKTLSDRR